MLSVLGSPTTPQTQRRRKYLWIFVAIICLSFIIGSSRHTSAKLTDYYYGYRQDHGALDGNGRSRRTHIAVASRFFAHFDVYLAAVKTLQDVLGDKGNIQVFAHTPFRFGFQEVADALELYDGEIQHPDSFMAAINSTTLYPNEEGKMIDLVILGTCEIDMNQWSDELVEAWDARPPDQKFKVVCIVHHARDTNWQRHIARWSSRGALRLMPIGRHVGHAFRMRFDELADSPEPELYKAMFEYIDIDVHVPVLDIPEYGLRRAPSLLSRAAIQGSLTSARRDYPHIFQELLAALNQNPRAWGYSPLLRDGEAYEPLGEVPDEAFTLHLIGEGTQLDIPKELSNIIVFHAELDYIEFYTLMQSMDVIIPAFPNQDYYDFQASSTVAMSVECNVPILASHRMRNSYGYIDDERVTITRPQALREISAINVLRTGFSSSAHFKNENGTFLDTSPHVDEFLRDVDTMLLGGWRRTREEFRTFKQELWAQNRQTIIRILEDSHGEI